MNKVDAGWNLDNSYLSLPDIFYTRVKANKVTSPKLIILNNPLAKLLGFNIEGLQDKEAIDILAGNDFPEGSNPIAQAYGGHQFGHFTMLGDGRAILIGEQISPSSERFDIQLKGSGPTPYSRGGDGRAALGPMLREYIISEAMYSLGIPTTRSLAVVTTGDKINRETRLPGAVLTRVAKSHIRVGTFQYASGWGSLEDVKALADYSIKRHFPEVEFDENPYISLLNRVIRAQASLIAKWQLVGFIHGVMNTDNMTISGESIDYGPCAFMDVYDPQTVFSSIDRNGRYAYGNQPIIGEWNLSRFAETLLPLIDDNKEQAIKIAGDSLKNFEKLYNNYWIKGMRSKLGLFNEEVEDRELIQELLYLMEKYKADYTNTFVGLTIDKVDRSDLFNSEEFKTWYNKWQSRLDKQDKPKELLKELMRNSNPYIIPRNHQVERALEAAVKNEDYSVLYRLLEAISSPYKHVDGYEEYMAPPQPSNIPYRTFCGT